MKHIKSFKIFESNQVIAYHVTRKDNIESILKYGIVPKVPEDYGSDGDG